MEWALSIREASDSVARSDRLSKYPVASKLRLVRDRKICVTEGVQLRIRENTVGDVCVRTCECTQVWVYKWVGKLLTCWCVCVSTHMHGRCTMGVVVTFAI